MHHIDSLVLARGGFRLDKTYYTLWIYADGMSLALHTIYVPGQLIEQYETSNWHYSADSLTELVKAWKQCVA